MPERFIICRAWVILKLKESQYGHLRILALLAVELIVCVHLAHDVVE